MTGIYNSSTTPDIGRLLQLLGSAAPTPATPAPANSWANDIHPDIITLLRQLSANVAKSPMPGGRSGDVRIPAFGAPGAPELNTDAKNYGESGGETTFFNQAIGGGYKPISSLATALGYPAAWNPLGTAPAPAPAPAPQPRPTPQQLARMQSY